jgi:hypothetical protein
MTAVQLGAIIVTLSSGPLFVYRNPVFATPVELGDKQSRQGGTRCGTSEKMQLCSVKESKSHVMPATSIWSPGDVVTMS